ncbi:hypothetical protein [Hymenobacter edaphi]|uniref:Uncharacterized protein n=1 Tax=Hymenobacter edaphi TaxID=2211146 RepID=A0A328BB56_9BACT|nr:hypothetical protein [Hymenobacter edaphi]RAK64009.1 hypothetical protein DLM85_18850 [Hymenobacter edaphi]
MRISPRLTALLTGLLLSATATQAQTTPGQATLEEKKVQIWCATVRYVYNDNGRSNLNNTLRCDGTLKAFESSIRADSQRVYSLVYQPLEGKGVMYKGLGSDQSRLQRLAKEIITKLGGSPQRRKDPARMAQLNRLQAALTGYVEQGTPIPGDIGQVNAEAAEAAYDSTATETPESLTAAEAGDTETAATVPAQTASAESPMTRLFGPIALILSLLSLVLWFLERRVLRNHIDELKNRASRHRNELDSMKHNGSRGMGPETVAAELTFSQRKQIEELVERMVQQRLAGQQPHGRAAAETAPAMPAKPAAPAPDVRKAPLAPPAAPAPRPAPAVPPVAQAPVPPVSEVPAPSVAVPAGLPPAAAADEFDSLVPPVQLPQPVAPAPVPAAPAPAVPHQPEPMPLGKFYVKVPVNGGFSDYDLHTVAQHDSIYEITPDPQRPDVASFRINPDPQVHPYAIQSAQYSLREACRYQPPTGPAIRIITEEPGQLRKVGPAWQIEQKAAIRFE